MDLTPGHCLNVTSDEVNNDGDDDSATVLEVTKVATFMMTMTSMALLIIYKEKSDNEERRACL